MPVPSDRTVAARWPPAAATRRRARCAGSSRRSPSGSRTARPPSCPCRLRRVARRTPRSGRRFRACEVWVLLCETVFQCVYSGEFSPGIDDRQLPGNDVLRAVDSEVGGESGVGGSRADFEGRLDRDFVVCAAAVVRAAAAPRSGPWRLRSARPRRRPRRGRALRYAGLAGAHAWRPSADAVTSSMRRSCTNTASLVEFTLNLYGIRYITSRSRNSLAMLRSRRASFAGGLVHRGLDPSFESFVVRRNRRFWRGRWC